jgi:hypothetical protein
MNMRDLFRNKIDKRYVNRGLISLFFICFSFLAIADKESVLPANQDKNLILDLLLLSKMTQELNGFNVNDPKISELIRQVESQVNVASQLFEDRSQYQLFRRQVDQQLNESLSLIHLKDKERSNLNGINIKVIEPQLLPECSGVTPESTKAALLAKEIGVGILAATKYTCTQGALVGNAASGCIALEIIAQAVKATYEFTEFCSRGEIYAFDFSVFEIMRNMIEHMNTFIDDTNVASRATVASTVLLQDSLDDANTSVNNAFPIINTDLNTALIGLNQNIENINTINAQASSLLQRLQFNQIEIENIAITSSDLKQISVETRADTQALITSLNNLQDSLNAQNQETQLLLKKTENSQIEYAMLGSSAKANLVYQIPGFKGGLLDRTREILVTSLSAIETAGGNTVQARSLFVLGNSHYNNQQYKAAFAQYSLAYQALLESSF